MYVYVFIHTLLGLERANKARKQKDAPKRIFLYLNNVSLEGWL